ncbi:uncharacterized protein EV420DRAFT_1735655 [Desarmillaria tabescens]|uniref:DNA 3'-5' helicase n=1 Tax=Armillaria tabescens TaxID=1929756 RepID=A0AA39MM81_ARMTA|nr:uncharacterized protein EV420DRAFT_1735655 [Desarmillaria tabescens]KAK0439083.1 hypothetical protein EV420DRAFT_1735655 [Desarmillaria tabescens]
MDRCKEPGCPNPVDTSNHKNNYHGHTYTYKWLGNTVTIHRRSDGLLDCPCSEPLHRRYSNKIIKRLVTANNPHPPAICTDEKYLDLFTSSPSGRHVLVQPPTNPMIEGSQDTPGDTEIPMQTDASSSSHQLCTQSHTTPMAGKSTSVVDEQSRSDEETSSDEGTEDEIGESEDGNNSDAGDDPEGVVTQSDARSLLLSCGLVVDERYRAIICIDCHIVLQYSAAYSHRVKRHSAYHKHHSRTVGKPKIMSCLQRLLAHIPKYPSPDCEGIPQVESIKLEEFWGCGVSGCTYKRIWKSARYCRKHHTNSAHGELSASERQPVKVLGHCFIRIKSRTLYVRAFQSIPPSTSSSDHPLSIILHHSKSKGVGDPQKTLTITDNRETTAVLYHSEWIPMLRDVPLAQLMANGSSPRKDEPELLRLKESVRAYYQAIPPVLSQIGRLTRTQIATAELSHSDFKAFKEPQNLDSLIQDADEMSRFISFQLRSVFAPIENYPVSTHPFTREKLYELHRILSDKESLEANVASNVHQVIWYFLRHPTPEFLQDDLACPLSRYLVAAHIKSARGQFSMPRFVPPTLSRLQWSFRATACREILNIRLQYNNETHKAYLECVRPYLTVGHQTLFNSLKQSHAFFTTLAKNEPGFARFNWDSDFTVLSMDGQPILMTDFTNSITRSIQTLESRLNTLFRGCEFVDILDHISQRLNPEDPKMWIQDDPHNHEYGGSFITNPMNGFTFFGPDKEDVRYRLLRHLSCQENLFVKVTRDDGNGPISTLQEQRGNIMDWISELNECVKLVYYLVTATWGGGARGTETTLIQYANTTNDRHVYVFNGMLTIVTNYAKTQSIQGHGVRVARCPSYLVSQLLILLVTVVYPAAMHLSAYVLSRELSENYASHLFVISGRRMDTQDFTRALTEITSTYLRVPLGVRSWRQVMHTMLVNLANVDFASPDQLDEEVKDIHAMFAHSKDVGEHHYSLQTGNALTDISATAVSSNQRISLRWHAVTHLLHPALLKSVHSNNAGGNYHSDALFSVFDVHFDSVTKAVQRSTKNVVASIGQQTSVIKTIVEETSQRAMIGAMSYVHARLMDTAHADQRKISNFPPIQVHPDLFKRIQPSIPAGSRYFRSPQQAELVQSTLSSDHVLAIMPTGSGKSLAFFSAPYLDDGGLYVVITPLTALTEDMGRRLRQNDGIRGGIYPEFSSLDGQLVFAAAHYAGTETFYNWVDKQADRLRRVFIDECHHLYLSTSYRSCFKLFYRLTALGKPITFLSATVFPQSIPLLCKCMGIPQETLRIIRTSTARRNIRYSVTHVPKSMDMVGVVTEFCAGIKFGPDDRGIIYTRTIADAIQLSRILQCDYYISKVDPNNEENNTIKKREIISTWQSGEDPKRRWIVGTQCLGEGIDQSNVRITVHFNVTTLIDVVQQTGRAGRDGKLAYSFIFWNELPWTSKKEGSSLHIYDQWDDFYDVEAGQEHYGIDELILLLHERYQCLRIRFVKPLDGDAHTCAALGGALCENCERLLSVRTPTNMCQDPNLEVGFVADVAPSHSFSAPPIPSILLAQEHEGVLPRVQNVRTAAEKVQQHYKQSDAHATKLLAAVNHLTSYGCADCWISRDPRQVGTPHKHAVPAIRHRVLSMTLDALVFDDSDHIYTPICYRCWIPFHHPFNHPPVAKKHEIDEECCPYNKNIRRIIPTAIKSAFMFEVEGGFVYRDTIAKRLGIQPWNNIEEFAQWLRVPVKGASRARNCHTFIVELHELLTETVPKC